MGAAGEHAAFTEQKPESRRGWGCTPARRSPSLSPSTPGLRGVGGFTPVSTQLSGLPSGAAISVPGVPRRYIKGTLETGEGQANDG